MNAGEVIPRAWEVLGRADQLPAPPGHQAVNAAKTALTNALMGHSRLIRAEQAPGAEEMDAAAGKVAEATEGVIAEVRQHYGDETARTVAGETGGAQS